MAFPLLERTDSSTLGIMQRTVWFLGTKFSSLLVVVAIVAEKPPIVTAELIVVTTRSVL